MSPIRHILVAVDFHAASRRALAYATRLAQAMGARLTVLHVFEVVVTTYPMDLPLPIQPAEMRRDAEREIAELVASIAARGVAVTGLVRDGMPAKAIVEASRDGDVDLVVLGTHGRRGIRRLVLGSVAEQVVRRSAIPVTTIHEWHFDSRADATRLLARKVEPLRGEFDVTVAITRGAVPMAVELARVLKTPVDALIVEPVITDREMPVGAVAAEGSPLLDQAAVATFHLGEDLLARAIDVAREVARERGRWLTASGTRLCAGARVLVVTDVLMCAATALVAARALVQCGAKRVSLAVPVCASALVVALPPAIDSTLCVETTQFESPVARVYQDESEPTNAEAAQLLVRAGRALADAASFTS